MGRNITVAVIESLQYAHPKTLDSLLHQYSKIYLFEPRVAYHIQGRGIRFFPSDQDPIGEYRKDGRSEVLSAALFDPGRIYVDAAERAVATVEQVYPFYRAKHVYFIDFASRLLRSPDAEYAYKKELCDQLARYYSLNIYCEKVSRILKGIQFHLFPGMNVLSYLSLHNLVKEAGLPQYAHAYDLFSLHAVRQSKREHRGSYAQTAARLLFQTVASIVLSPVVHLSFALTKQKEYRYAMTVLGTRQLYDTDRNPFFLADEKTIHTPQVALIPFPGVSRAALRENSCADKQTVQIQWYMSFYRGIHWLRFIFYTIRSWNVKSVREMKLTTNLLVHHAQWQCLGKKVRIHHFITHSDFDMSHIGRNIALRESGTQTWYFTDSMNHGCDLRAPGQEGMRHPFWSYLLYDHFVTWSELLASYWSEHPGPPKETHVIGCLWSQHISQKESVDQSRVSFDLKRLDDMVVIGAFDTTYSRNGFFSYQEGIAFAKHLETVLVRHPDIVILLKEKKARAFHRKADPQNGPLLEEIYEALSKHPRVIVCRNTTDPSVIISLSDLVISMPFTSPTFETLSVDRAAIWHDPFGHHRNTVYAVAGVTTHSIEELVEKIQTIKNISNNAWKNPIPPGSPLLDPFRDGKAIDRFRELLRSS